MSFRYFATRRRKLLSRSGAARSGAPLGLRALEDRNLLSLSGLLPGLAFDTCQSVSVAGEGENPGAALPGQAAPAALMAALDGPSAADPPEALPNASPVAADDAYAMGNNQQLGAGVLANDSDPEGDRLTVVLGDGPGHGQLTLHESGLFTYKPEAGFEGTDSFTYTAFDGQASSEVATVRIAVSLVNRVPQAENDEFAVAEGESLDVSPESGILANDSDAEGGPLAASLVDGPANGTVMVNPDGSFQYTPNAGFSGTDSFTYRANDGQADSNLATVSITVQPANHAPQAQDDAYALSADGTLSPDTGVLANDSDAEGDALTASLVDGPANGTVTLNSDGSFQYAPNAGFSGTDSFTYRANDGQADSNLATVSITVEAVNGAPVAQDDAYALSADGTLSPEGGVLANDSDAEGDALTASLVDGPANGTVTLNSDGSFQYVPNAGFSGTDTFTYRASDGQADSNLATVSITVEAVNGAPVAQDDAYALSADGTLSPDTGVLANDSDAEGDALAASLVDGPANGTVTLNSDGSFQYAPNAGFSGTDTFTYRASDGQADSNLATVSITVGRADLKVHLETSGTAFGADTGGHWGGSTFWVNSYVQDLRELAQGVVGGAIDVEFDPAVVAPTGRVVYGDQFTAFQQGQADGAAAAIDEAGALATVSGVGADGLAPFVAWEFVRVGAPVAADIQFAADPGEGTATITPANFALVGDGSPVDWSAVDFDAVDLALRTGDFNDDGLVNHFDLALWLPRAGGASEDPGFDAEFDLNADYHVDGLDLDILLAGMFQPQADQPGDGLA